MPLPRPPYAIDENAGSYLSLRDYFAVQVLPLLASETISRAVALTATMHGLSNAETIARCAYELADALLIAREKGSAA